MCETCSPGSAVCLLWWSLINADSAKLSIRSTCPSKAKLCSLSLKSMTHGIHLILTCTNMEVFLMKSRIFQTFCNRIVENYAVSKILLYKFNSAIGHACVKSIYSLNYTYIPECWNIIWESITIVFDELRVIYTIFFISLVFKINHNGHFELYYSILCLL